MSDDINIELKKPASSIRIQVIEGNDNAKTASPARVIFSLLYLLLKISIFLIFIPIYIYLGITVLLVYIAILFAWVFIKALMINFIIRPSRKSKW